MLVVAVVPLYPPESRVGAWLSTHEYLRHLGSLGHTVQVVRYLTMGTRYALDGVDVFDKHWLDLVAGADVVVSHLGDDGRSADLAARYSKPLVRMVHGHTPDAASKLNGAHLAVFNARATADDLAWDGPQVVCHPITWPDDHRANPGEAVTLVNLAPEKGGALFSDLTHALPDVRFLGVRGGWGTTQRVPAAPNLTIVPTTQNMRALVWAHTRVLLVPSERETWCMAAVEAMCSGIPVIAHPTPGLRESLGDAAVFIDRGDQAAWEREIRRLQDPDEWAEASRVATRRAEELTLNNTANLNRFAAAIEALVGVPA